MSRSNNKYEKICWCCLTEEGQMKNMQDELPASVVLKIQLAEGYEICSGITFDEIGEPSHIKMICCPCEQKLQSSIEFRELCRKSYQILKEKAEIIPDLYLDVKHEVQSSDDDEHEIVVENKSTSFTEVYINNDFTAGSSTHKDHHTKPLKTKKNYYNSKKPIVQVPSDVDASDLESDYMCLRCDIVLPTHREYLKHFKEHKTGNGIPRIHKVCDICQVFTKRYTRHIFEQHKDYKPYKCKYCVKSFQLPGHLRSHLTSHAVSKTPSHECLTCHEKFGRLNAFRSHISNHKNTNNQYFCPFCGLTFDQFFPLSEHFFLKHDINKTRNLYPCFKCKRVYLVGKYFDVHECSGKIKSKKPKTTNTVNCARCSITFSSEDEYVCHQFLGCRDIQPQYCAICDKTFPTKYQLQRHVNGSHVQKSKSFICDKCGYAAAHSFQYDLHMASHETERKFKCPHSGCKAAFKHLVILKSHEKRHEKKMVFECDFCKKRFPFYENIKRHILNSHSDSSKFRKFACEVCGLRTGSASALLKHKISHTGEKSVKCKVCSKKFSHNSAANHHYRKCHQGQHWQCKFCGNTFKSIVALKQHLFIHRGFFPYNCPMCTAHHSDKYLFKRHLRNQHKLVYDEKIHGYVEKENLDELVKECERRTDTDLESLVTPVPVAETDSYSFTVAEPHYGNE